MFKNIIDPYTKQKYSICSEEGKQLLNKYINNVQKGGTQIIPPTSIAGSPSVSITSTKIPGPQKGYLDTFLNLQNPPQCSKEQMNELNILIEALNQKIVEETSSFTIETDIQKLKEEKKKLKAGSDDDALLMSLVRKFNTVPGVVTANTAFMRTKRNLNMKHRHLEDRHGNVRGLEYRIQDKRGLVSTDRDYEQLARWKYDLKETTTDEEQTENKEKKSILIEELVKALDAKIAAKHQKQNREQRKIFIVGTNNKCIKPNDITLEIRNLDLKYGNSPTDTDAISINLRIVPSPRDPYTLIVNVTGTRNITIFLTPIIIMIPRSIFILDLKNIITNTNDEELEYIKGSFKNTTGNKSYFKSFVDYILSFADNLNKGNTEGMVVFATPPPHTSNLKVIGLLHDTYMVDAINKKHNVLVKVNNFQNYGEIDDDNKITIDLQMSIIPSYNHLKIKTNAVTKDITINDYAKSNIKYKQYGKLNFLNEQTKIVDDYVLGLATPSWCPIL